MMSSKGHCPAPVLVFACTGYRSDGLWVAQPGFSIEQGLSQPSCAIAINDQADIAVNYEWSGMIGDGNNSYYRNLDATLVYQLVSNGVVQFATNQTAVFTNSTAASSGSRTDGFLTVRLDLLRADGFTGPVSVHYGTADGDAVADQDYVATNGTLTWHVGEIRPSRQQRFRPRQKSVSRLREFTPGENELLGAWEFWISGKRKHVRVGRPASRARGPGWDATAWEPVAGIVTPAGIFGPEGLW